MDTEKLQMKIHSYTLSIVGALVLLMRRVGKKCELCF